MPVGVASVAARGLMISAAIAAKATMGPLPIGTFYVTAPAPAVTRSVASVVVPTAILAGVGLVGGIGVATPGILVASLFHADDAGKLSGEGKKHQLRPGPNTVTDSYTSVTGE